MRPGARRRCTGRQGRPGGKPAIRRRRTAGAADEPAGDKSDEMSPRHPKAGKSGDPTDRHEKILAKSAHVHEEAGGSAEQSRAGRRSSRRTMPWRRSRISSSRWSVSTTTCCWPKATPPLQPRSLTNIRHKNAELAPRRQRTARCRHHGPGRRTGPLRRSPEPDRGGVPAPGSGQQASFDEDLMQDDQGL